MANAYLIKHTLQIFEKIVTCLIYKDYRLSKGGATLNTMSKALDRLEKKTGALSEDRIVDYLVSATYVFKDRGSEWTINQVIGPKSIKRLTRSKEKKYYEDQWLKSGGLTRAELKAGIQDKSVHPLAQYVYMAMEEGTKSRMLNTEAGYTICQVSTLGWSPKSESCAKCQFAEKCKIETKGKFPEIYRLRIEEYGNQE